MPQMQTMTQQEEADIMLEAIKFLKQGNLDEYERTKRQIPLSPYMAKFIKEHIEYFGEDFFEKYGWNLAEAKAVYGTDYFTR